MPCRGVARSRTRVPPRLTSIAIGRPPPRATNIKFWRGDLLVGCWRHILGYQRNILELQRSSPEKAPCLAYLFI
jgi:hypothetical protein